MNSSISSTDWNVGDTITLNATSTTVMSYPIILWVINYTSLDLAKSGEELRDEGRIFAMDVATDSTTEVVTSTHSNVNTLTPIIVEAGAPSYLGYTMSIPFSELQQNNRTYEIGTTYNITYILPGQIRGIVTWLKQWFYTKDEVYDTGWTSLTYTTNMQNYSGQPVRIRRIGKVVHIEGAFTSTLTSGSTFPLHQQICNENNISTYSDSYSLTIGILDEKFRPSDTIYTVQQGSGINKFLLLITPEGKVRIGKYGSSSDVDPQSNPWFNINVTYMVD